MYMFVLSLELREYTFWGQVMDAQCKFTKCVDIDTTKTSSAINKLGQSHLYLPMRWAHFRDVMLVPEVRVEGLLCMIMKMKANPSTLIIIKYKPPQCNQLSGTTAISNATVCISPNCSIQIQ